MDNKAIKAALFDLDGVVFDTEPQYTEFWGSQCRLYHPEHPGLEFEIKGQTLEQIYDRWFSGPLSKEQAMITERLNSFESQMSYNYVSGFPDFIADLRSQGVRTAIVTSSNRIKMGSVLRQHPEIPDFFDAILTSEDFTESKPSPDCYLCASKRLEVRKEEAIVFEDSFNGITSGKSAGMFVVGLATTNSVEAIKPFCDYQICNYTDFNYNKLLSQFTKNK